MIVPVSVFFKVFAESSKKNSPFGRFFPVKIDSKKDVLALFFRLTSHYYNNQSLLYFSSFHHKSNSKIAIWECKNNIFLLLTLENRLVSGCLAPQARKNITLSCVSKENRVFLICVFYLYSLFSCLSYAIGRPKSSFSNFREHSKKKNAMLADRRALFQNFAKVAKKLFCYAVA